MNLDLIAVNFRKIVIGLTLVVVAWQGYQYYEFQTNAEESPLLKKRSELEVVSKENEELRKKIDQAREFKRSLEAKKQEIRDLYIKLANLQASLNDELDTPNLIRVIDQVAKEAGLKYTSLNPGAMTTKEYYVDQIFDLSFHGVYIQLLVFLQKISTVQRIIRVENLSITRRGPANAAIVQVEGTAQLKAYRYNASKADQVAADLNKETASSKGSTPSGTATPKPGEKK